MCIGSYMMAFLIKQPVVSSFFYSLYSCCLDVSVYLIILLLYIFEDRDTKTRLIRRNRIIYICLATVDVLLLLTNYFTNFYFELGQIIVEGIFIGWAPIYTIHYYHIHLFLCYGLSSIIGFRFIVDAINAPKFHRKKYNIILILFVSVIFMNALGKIMAKNHHVDFSLISYGILMIVGFAFTNYLLPRGLKRNMLSIASDKISDAVICYDYEGKCIYANDLARKLNIENNDNTQWRKNFFESEKSLITGSEKILLDGEEHYFELEFRRVEDKRGKVSGFYLKLMDRTLEIQTLEREQYRSTHDELTGLYNRKYFLTKVEQILKETPDIPRYLIATDIVKFKLLNDVYGTKFGDEVLKHQAQMLSRASYDDTVLGRISGDKFGMLIRKEYFKPELAIANTLDVMEFSNNANCKLNIMIGLYEIANPYESVLSMWDKANLAIEKYASKNQILCIYDTSLMNAVLNENKIISDFKNAIENDQFCMFIQPQIDSETEKCIGGEALCRWETENGYRQPSEFIPLLEKAGLIYQLDHYIWRKAAQKLKEWKAAGLDYYISVNISVKDFYYLDIYSIFTGLVKEYEVSPHKLHLEITESVIIGDKAFHRNILSKLRAYGFSIEMDDFGSGFSSLNALKEMHMDVLKIDMEFLHTTENVERGRVIIAAVVKMAKSLGMKVISEGVEKQTQAQFLRECGVEIFQGYLYARPMPMEEFEQKYVEVKQ